MKVCLIADLHFGAHKNNVGFFKSQMKFYDQMKEYLLQNEIKTIVILGDVFDDRTNVNVYIENHTVELFKDLSKDFNIHIITGNHDIYYTTTTEVNSLKNIAEINNIVVYEKPTNVSFDGVEVTMLPWLCEKPLPDLKAKYCFGHLDIIGMKMDKVNVCEKGIAQEDLCHNWNYIYTGHFHKRNTFNNITYVGSPYELTRIDENEQKGFTILELNDNTTKFIENVVSSRYKTITYPNETNGDIRANDFVDVKVPVEYGEKLTDVSDWILNLNLDNPANVVMVDKQEEKVEIEVDDNIDIFKLMQEYLDMSEYDNKQEIMQKFTKLYYNQT